MPQVVSAQHREPRVVSQEPVVQGARPRRLLREKTPLCARDSVVSGGPRGGRNRGRRVTCDPGTRPRRRPFRAGPRAESSRVAVFGTVVESKVREKRSDPGRTSVSWSSVYGPKLGRGAVAGDKLESIQWSGGTESKG